MNSSNSYATKSLTYSGHTWIAIEIVGLLEEGDAYVMLNLFIGRGGYENKRQDRTVSEDWKQKNGNTSTEKYNNNDTFDGCSSSLDTPEDRINVLNDRLKEI